MTTQISFGKDTAASPEIVSRGTNVSLSGAVGLRGATLPAGSADFADSAGNVAGSGSASASSAGCAASAGADTSNASRLKNSQGRRALPRIPGDPKTEVGTGRTAVIAVTQAQLADAGVTPA